MLYDFYQIELKDVMIAMLISIKLLKKDRCIEEFFQTI